MSDEPDLAGAVASRPTQLSAVELELVEGRRFRVLSLDQLIEVKARLGRPKDRVVEAELRAIRDLLGS